jgi:hypothetical protein
MAREKVAKVDPKKKVNVVERLMLLSLLPKEGSFTNLRLLRVVKEALSFSEAENKKLKFKQTEGPDGVPVVNWTPGVVAAKVIFFGDVVEKIIRDELVRLDKAEKITENHYSLYEKFMEGHEGESGE